MRTAPLAYILAGRLCKKVKKKIVQHVGSVEHLDGIECPKQLAEDSKFLFECECLKMKSCDSAKKLQALSSGKIVCSAAWSEA